MTLLGALLALLAAFPATASALDVDSNDNAGFVEAGRLFRFDYANDFFASRDRYYTQGFGFTLFHPSIGRSPASKLLAALPGSERAHGLVFRHSGFTPTSLYSDAIRFGDRPFACYLFLGEALVSRSPDRDLALASELDVGLIGQGAGGEWIQTGLHRGLGNLLPHGWANQVRNDLVLDYSARLEKTLAAAAFADGGAFADATLGTLYTNAGAGLSARAGRINGRRKLYAFGRVHEKLVGYDATLQGGLFNRGSPYTLSAAQLDRLVFRADLGVAWDRGPFAVEFTRTALGREFREGLNHQWGRLSLLWRF